MFELEVQQLNIDPKHINMNCSILQAIKLARYIRVSFKHGVVDVYHNGEWIKEYC